MNKSLLAEKFLVVIFLFFIISPFMVWIISDDQAVSVMENRNLQQKPAQPADLDALKSYPQQFDQYINDQIGFREQLIGFYNDLMMWMGKSSHDSIIMGEQGWLFHNLNDVFASYDPARQYTEEEVSAWARYIRERRDWLAGQGINYVFMPVPDKHAIYQEYLPLNYRLMMQSNNPHTLMDQLENAGLDAHLVDIYPALEQRKQAYEYPLYSLTDSHWNALGASIANAVLYEKLTGFYPDIKPWLPEDIGYRVAENQPGGGLAKMLGKQEVLRGDVPVILWQPDCLNNAAYNFSENPFGLNWRKNDKYDHSRHPYIIRCDSGYPYKVLVFRDSYWDTYRLSMGRDFAEIVVVKLPEEDFFNDYLLLDYVARYKPDIVLEQRVYRFLPRQPRAHLKRIVDARRTFEINEVKPHSLFSSATATNMNYSNPARSAYALLKKPSFRSTLSFSMKDIAAEGDMAVHLAFDSQSAAQFDIELLQKDGSVALYDVIPVKTGTNQVFFTCSSKTEGFRLVRWERTSEIKLLAVDVIPLPKMIGEQ